MRNLIAALAAVAGVLLASNADGLAQDPILCLGRAATIVGTDGADVITNRREAQVIHALGGDDVVDGADGDLICGGDGNDSLGNGGGIDSTFSGGAGDDIIRASHQTVSYAEAPAGIHLEVPDNFSDIIVTGWGRDTLANNVRVLVGSRHDDMIIVAVRDERTDGGIRVSGLEGQRFPFGKQCRGSARWRPWQRSDSRRRGK